MTAAISTTAAVASLTRVDPATSAAGSSITTPSVSATRILPRRRDRSKQQILVVEAEVREWRHRRHLERIDRSVRGARESHIRVLEVLGAAARDERVVLPMLEVTHECGGAAEPEDEPAILEGHGGVSVQVVAVRSRVQIGRAHV